MRNRNRAVRIAGLVLAVSLGGCGALVATPQGQAPSPGPVDAQLFKIDPFTILRSVAGAESCVQGTLTGSSGGNDAFHATSDYTCPRAGDDRSVYFAFADTYEAALRAAGATVSESWTESGDASEPISKGWTVRGNARAGTARLIGDNGVGTLRLFVTLDLQAP